MGGIRLAARVRGSEIEQSPSNSAPMAYRRKMGDTITLKLEQWSILTLPGRLGSPTFEPLVTHMHQLYAFYTLYTWFFSYFISTYLQNGLANDKMP